MYYEGHVTVIFVQELTHAYSDVNMNNSPTLGSL